MTDDAFHVAQPHPAGSGTAMAIDRSLARAGIGPDQLDYVNAHGTGTALNNVAEAAALRAAFGDCADQVFVSATKSTTGHTLEASGALEAVITLLAVRSSVLPPTAGLIDPDPACTLRHVAISPRQAEVSYAMSLSSSVGGLNAALLLGGP